MSKITDINAALDSQFERVEMSNLDKVFERNRVTSKGIDAMITNYLKLERELVAEKERVRQSTNSNARLEKFLAEAQAEITRLKGEAESWEQVFDKTCEHLAEAKTEIAALKAGGK